MQISYSIIQQKFIIENQSLELQIDNIIQSKFSKFSDALNSIEANNFYTLDLNVLEQFDWLASISIYENADTIVPKMENLTERPSQTFKQFSSIENDITTLTLRAASANLQNRVFYSNLNSKVDNEAFVLFVITKQKANNGLVQVLGWLDLNVLLDEIKQTLPRIYSMRFVGSIGKEASEEVAWAGSTVNPNLSYEIIRFTSYDTPLYEAYLTIFSDPQILRIIGVNLLLWIALISLWREHLERLKTERKTHALAQKIDEQARLVSIGEIASAVAHEINQPLATIETYASIGKQEIRKLKKNDSLEEILDKIQSQTERCARIMKSILGLKAKSKIELSKITFKKLEENIRSIIENKAKNHQVKIKWMLNPKTSFYGDLTSSEQIFLNLCNNGIEAMEFTSPENRVLEIYERKSDLEGFIDIVISDNGCGVETGLEANIFKPFVSTKERGTGIGLSLCKSLLEKINGNISLQNKSPHGTEFIITFPLKKKIFLKKTEDPHKFIGSIQYADE